MLEVSLQLILLSIFVSVFIALSLYKLTAYFLNKSEPHIPMIIENYSTKQTTRPKKKQPIKVKPTAKPYHKLEETVKSKESKNKASSQVSSESVVISGKQKTTPVSSANRFDVSDDLLQQIANGESVEPIVSKPKKSKKGGNKTKQSTTDAAPRSKNVSFSEGIKTEVKSEPHEPVDTKIVKAKTVASPAVNKNQKKETQSVEKPSKPLTPSSKDVQSVLSEAAKSGLSADQNSKKKKNKRQRAKSGASDDSDFTLVKSHKSAHPAPQPQVKKPPPAPVSKAPVKETVAPMKVESVSSSIIKSSVKQVDNCDDLGQVKQKLILANQSVENLKNELNEEKKKGSKKKESDDGKTQIAALTQQLKRTNEEKDLLKNAVIDAEKRAQLFQKELTANIAQLEIVKREKATLTTKLAQLETQVNSHANDQEAHEDAKELKKELEASKAKSVQDLQAVQKARDDALHKIEKLETEVKTLKQERIKNQNISPDKKANVTSQPSSPRENHHHHDKTEQVIKEKDSKIMTMEKELNKLNQEIENQRQKNSDLEERLRNKKSSTPESSPAPVKKVQEDEPEMDWLNYMSSEPSGQDDFGLDSDDSDSECHPSGKPQPESEVAKVADSGDADWLDYLSAPMSEDNVPAMILDSDSEEENDSAVLNRQSQSADSNSLTKLEDKFASNEKLLKEEICDLTVEVNGLKTSLECLPQLEEKLQQAITRVDASDKELSHLQADLACKRAHIHTLESELIKMGAAVPLNEQIQLDESALQRENKELIKQLQESVSARGELSESTPDESNNSRIIELEEELDHYKSVLRDTEALLSKLQESVDNEENRWREALKTSEEECEKARSELEKVYHQLQKHDTGNLEGMTDLNFAYNCVEKSLSIIITKMEDRIKELEKSGENVTQEKHQLSEDIKKMEGRIKELEINFEKVTRERNQLQDQLSNNSENNKRHENNQLKDGKINSHSDSPVNGVGNKEVDSSHSNSSSPGDPKSLHHRAGSVNSSS